jgi:hypothetical protein
MHEGWKNGDEMRCKKSGGVVVEEVIRTIEHWAGQPGDDSRAISDIYNGDLDAIIVREAFPFHAVTTIVSRFQEDDPTTAWNRPNKPMPGIDLRLVGVGAAPCATAPQGPQSADYFEAATSTADTVRSLFGESFDPFTAIESSLHEISGKTVQVPVARDRRSYSACTLRAIPAGEGLMLHHDRHYGLDIYEDMRPQVDSSLLLSFFVLLQRPLEGGRLCVYQMGPDEDGDLPRLAHGVIDPVAFHERVPHQYFDLAEGDMIVFASGRLYHTVETVAGARARVTLGGFLALDKQRERCFYWS